jgi:type II secretory pathway pseudopilin PulG
MQQGFKLRNYKITKLQNSQGGYILITLMLAFALIALALLAALPEIGQQIRRDREEELQHRGTAYMRAIQHYYKKFGRYPNSVSDLENTNNLRFLRKAYKDPVNRDPATGKEKDFKLLHQQDIALNNGPLLNGIPGQATGQSFGGQTGGMNGMQPGMQGGLGSFGSQPGGAQTGAAKTPDSANGDSDSGENSKASGSSGSPSPFGSGNAQTFGGGPILGVASMSKEKTIRVFFDKNHYKDWLFIYVNGMERAGLLTGPVNPNAPTGNVGGLTPQQMNAGANSFGQGQSMGQGLGQGLMGNSGSLAPSAPPQQPPQQTPPPQQ